MKRGGLYICALLLCCPLIVRAAPGIVVTRSGQTYQGDVNDKALDSVTITVHGIPVQVKREDVLSIQYTAHEAQQLDARLAKLGPKDVNGRLALAREAFNQRQYIVARTALEQAQQIDPNNAEAAALMDTVQSQIRLEHTKQAETQTTTAPGTPPATQPANLASLLRPAEINDIRIAEMRPDDVGVRIRFDHNLLRRFVDYIGRDKAGNFYTLNAMQQAERILRQGSPEMKSDIEILNDPPSLLMYRRTVQPFILQNCATTGCHNGTQNLKFNMVLPADSDAATYTNFYRLIKYVKKLSVQPDQVFGQAEARMIDRQRPEQSLLLQYSLPGASVQYQHPEVANYHPPLHGVNDPRYQSLLHWISSSLQPVQPDYGFDDMHRHVSATEPSATKPAATRNTRPPRPLKTAPSR